MQLQDLLINYSDIRPFRITLLNKISGNGSRIIIKRLVNTLLPYYFKMYPGIDCYRKSQKEGRVSEAIVSLTSFPKRASVVWLVVECLLRQTLVPKKIVIWLAREQFPTTQSLPQSLSQYPKDIVEIRMVDEDIRSHKKYWYAIKEYHDSPLVLVDDDLVYDSRMIEDLEKYSSNNERVISCCWGSKMKWNDDGTAKPYLSWGGHVPLKIISDDFFYGSGGGTYFPVGSLDGAHQSIEDIMRVCPFADDIWLNAISRKNGYKTCLVRDFVSMPEWRIKENKTLNSMNNGQNRNDVQLENTRLYMLDKYGLDPFARNFSC